MPAENAQGTITAYLQGGPLPINGVTVTGVGSPAFIDGFSGPLQVEIRELAGGTATVILEGSLDIANSPQPVWYAVGYEQIDATASPTRSVSSISVTANSMHVYTVLDYYRQLRARISVISGATVVARVYAVPKN